MSSGYDDRHDRYDDGRGDTAGGDDAVARARAKVAIPGLFLVLSGLLGLALEVGGLGLLLTRPTAIYDFMVEMVEKTPPGPERQKQLDDLKAQEANMRLDTPVNIGSIVIGLILALVTVAGGMKMRALSGYGLSVAGAIASIIPIGGCCCLGIPVGIWALVVLLQPDVAAGFMAARQTAPVPRGEY